MNRFFSRCLLLVSISAAWLISHSAKAQLVAYDDGGNYGVSANWTNSANQGFGFAPWTILTNGPDFHGTYIVGPTNPPFVISSITNAAGTTNYDVWGVFANGTNDINETTATRGFASPLGTNTFKLQWGSRGAGVTTTVNSGNVHGYCGFALCNGNATNSTSDYQSRGLFFLEFVDGASPSTLYIADGAGVTSVPGTSFSDLGRGNITNAVQAELTVAADQLHYHLVLKDCVQGRTLYTSDSVLVSASTIDSAALFCHETTGDQVYNRMQITAPHVAPTIVNATPTNGSLFLDPNTTTLSFEVDSFLSTVSSSAVSVLLNGVAQSVSYNTASPTNQLIGTATPSLSPNTLYTWTIIATDANGDSTTNTYSFNTFLTTDLYIDAYDYNYNFGQFVDSAPVNAYANQLGVPAVDYNISDTTGTNNTAGYRPGDLPQILTLATDATGDPIDHANLRLNGHIAYNIGFTDIGNWENYTRSMPANTNYSIYARAASGGSGLFEIERLASPFAVTASQPNAALGRVSVPNTGGSRVFSGQLLPLIDAFGNTVVVNLAGTNTFRETAISSRGYNLEYLVFVPVTNALGTLNPYLAVASPAPNTIGAPLPGSITFTLANRQTLVLTNGLKMSLNGTNLTTGFTISSNAAGVTGTYTLTGNLAANSSNTVVVTFTNSALVAQTNTWTFVTGSSGGFNGNGMWSGGAAATNDLSWATAANWTNGTPGPGFSASFSSFGATTTLATNNIVTANTTISSLFYNTNNSGYHTTLIQDGVTLTASNPSTSISAIMQVGGTTGGDNQFNKLVTNTITGLNGALNIIGPSAAGVNQLNFQVRQCANPPVPEAVTLDMAGLGTMNALVGKFYLAQGGSGSFQSNVSARVNLARTNTITCLRANAGQFEVGDSSGGAITLPGSTLNLGITNAFFVDTMRIGKQKSTNNLVRFNPDLASLNPSLLLRGTNGLSSRVSVLTIGEADTEITFWPVFSQANVDLSAGRVDALVSTMVIGRDSGTNADTGFAQGTLSLNSGTFDVNSLQVGFQKTNHSATATGVVKISGPAMLISTNITLAQTNVIGNPALVSGTLNITNGTVAANITAGGGNSTVNINAGTLVVSNFAGTPAVPLTALNLVNASLHLKADGANLNAPVNASAVAATGTAITIDSVANVTGTQTVHLVSYSGSDPFAGFTGVTMPAGYTGTLVDNAGKVDLQVVVLPPPPSPSIGKISIAAGQVVISGTNNSPTGGGTYKVLTSTNVLLPRTNWVVLTNGTFSGSGTFSVTNAVGTNSQRFYQLQVP